MSTVQTVVVLLGILSRCAFAWQSEGVLPAKSFFASYVGKFCFDYFQDNDDSQRAEVGQFEVRLSGRVQKGVPTNENTGELYVVVYDDEKDHWKRVRPFWDQLTCKERRELASFELPVTTELAGTSGEFVKSIVVRQEIRPRFWYFTFINCGATIAEPVEFSVHAWNFLQGFENEFSLDQTGSLELDVSFAALFAATMGVIFIIVRDRNSHREVVDVATRSLPLLRLLGASAGCSALGCACRAVHHLVFAYNGKGVLLAAVFGTFWACLAKAVLTILQILIAKGWALLFTPDERPQRMAIAGILSAVISLSVGCEIWEQYFHDQSTNFYLHESWPGHIILTLNVFILVMAWYFMWDTYSREIEPAVRQFYALVSVACCIYFAALPVVCLLAELLSPWVRRKYVERVEVSTRFASTALLVFCLRPSHVSRLVSARLKNRDAPELLEREAREEMEQA